MTDPLTLWPLTGLPEVVAGDDLAALIAAAMQRNRLTLRDGDVLAVTSKVVSKALGLRAAEADRRVVIDRESVRVVAERATTSGPTRIVEGRTGVVAAAAGVDGSNTGPDGALLTLPSDPDAVAARLHDAIGRLVPGVRFAVLITDTAGRPWRAGQIDFALGSHGLRVLQDHRGHLDADGRELAVTAIAAADELAAAAELVKGKASGIPVALIRGAGRWVETADGERWTQGAAELIRTGPGDWFALGHVEAARAALGHPPGSATSAAIGIRPAGGDSLPQRLRRALALARIEPGAPALLDPGPVGTRVTISVEDAYAAGRLAARLEVALWSEGIDARVERDPAGVRVEVLSDEVLR